MSVRYVSGAASLSVGRSPPAVRRADVKELLQERARPALVKREETFIKDSRKKRLERTRSQRQQEHMTEAEEDLMHMLVSLQRRGQTPFAQARKSVQPFVPGGVNDLRAAATGYVEPQVLDSLDAALGELDDEDLASLPAADPPVQRDTLRVSVVPVPRNSTRGSIIPQPGRPSMRRANTMNISSLLGGGAASSLQPASGALAPGVLSPPAFCAQLSQRTSVSQGAPHDSMGLAVPPREPRSRPTVRKSSVGPLASMRASTADPVGIGTGEKRRSASLAFPRPAADDDEPGLLGSMVSPGRRMHLLNVVALGDEDDAMGELPEASTRADRYAGRHSVSVGAGRLSVSASSGHGSGRLSLTPSLNPTSPGRSKERSARRSMNAPTAPSLDCYYSSDEGEGGKGGDRIGTPAPTQPHPGSGSVDVELAPADAERPSNSRFAKRQSHSLVDGGGGGGEALPASTAGGVLNEWEMWAASEEMMLRDTRRRLQTKPPPRSMRVTDAPPHASAGLRMPPSPPSGRSKSPQRLPPDATTDGKQWQWCSDPPAHPGSTDGTAAFSSAADRAACAAHAEASVATPLQHGARGAFSSAADRAACAAHAEAPVATPSSTVRRASTYCAPAGEMRFGPPRFGRPQLALSPRVVSMTRERPRPQKNYG